MSTDIEGKTALIFGASTGIGAAIARRFGELGANLIVHYRSSAAEAEAVAADIRAAGGKADLLQGDIADPRTAGSLVEEAHRRLGRLDIVVNNAGIIRRAPAIDTTDADWSAVVDVNLNGVFRLCRAAGRHMLASGRGGKIINIASLLSFQGGLTVPAYAASKSGVAGLTKALSNEWAGKGINVNAIAPGYLRTDNTKALQNDETRNRQILERIPAGRWGEPSDLGGAVVFLASSAADYVHGHVLAVDGGWLGR